MARESNQEQETYDVYLLSLTCEHNTYIVSCGVPHVNTAFIAYQFMWHPTYKTTFIMYQFMSHPTKQLL